MSQLKSVLREEKASVLIVDDLWLNLELLETIFTRAGFEVFSALDGTSALAIFESHRIDIAIVDVMMPGMDGYELCKKLKSLTEKNFFPVILLTALTDKQSRITGLEAGADDFISKPFDTTELLVKVRSLIKLKNLQDELEHSENVIMTLAVAMESRDPYTRGHSTRVGEVATLFGAYLGLSPKEQEQIRKAGILHDIGKIGIDVNLLCKVGLLTCEEMEIIRQHPVVGEDICRPLVSIRTLLPTIRSHHERWDGTGFPDRLAGERIPVNARILAIADAFDAIVSQRPYREARSKIMALELMRNERNDGQWDPVLVRYFVEMMSKELQL